MSKKAFFKENENKLANLFYFNNNNDNNNNINDNNIHNNNNNSNKNLFVSSIFTMDLRAIQKKL